MSAASSDATVLLPLLQPASAPSSEGRPRRRDAGSVACCRVRPLRYQVAPQFMPTGDSNGAGSGTRRRDRQLYVFERERRVTAVAAVHRHGAGGCGTVSAPPTRECRARSWLAQFPGVPLPSDLEQSWPLDAGRHRRSLCQAPGPAGDT